jgi:hypothetical protein
MGKIVILGFKILCFLGLVSFWIITPLPILAKMLGLFQISDLLQGLFFLVIYLFIFIVQMIILTEHTAFVFFLVLLFFLILIYNSLYQPHFYNFDDYLYDIQNLFEFFDENMQKPQPVQIYHIA